MVYREVVAPLEDARPFLVAIEICFERVCPDLCVFGVIDGLHWAGLVKEDRADEQGSDNDWCAAC
jgi:hypothetical protein